MSQDFRQHDDGDDEQEDCSDGDNVIGKDESLSRLRGGNRAGRWGFQCRGFVAGHLQTCRGNGGHGGKRDSQRRNRLGSRSRGRNGRRIQTRGDFPRGPSALGFTEQRVASDVKERLRQRIRHDGICFQVDWHNWNALGEYLDKSYAEGPDVACSGEA